MPTYLYGPGDNFHPENSHVMPPRLIRRFDAAARNGDAEVVIWGTARRDGSSCMSTTWAAAFAVRDAPRSTRPIWPTPSPCAAHINVGTGADVSILDLARIVARSRGFRGEIRCDTTKPDGTPRKLMDVSRLRDMGWQARIELRDGIAATYRWFQGNTAEVRD